MKEVCIALSAWLTNNSGSVPINGLVSVSMGVVF